jgi:hypothetical protein
LVIVLFTVAAEVETAETLPFVMLLLVCAPPESVVSRILSQV